MRNSHPKAICPVCKRLCAVSACGIWPHVGASPNYYCGGSGQKPIEPPEGFGDDAISRELKKQFHEQACQFVDTKHRLGDVLKQRDLAVESLKRIILLTESSRVAEEATIALNNIKAIEEGQST